MTRLIRFVLLLALLTVLVAAAPSASAAAPLAPTAGCLSPLPKGLYKGSTSAVMDIRGEENGVLLQHMTMNDTGQLSLNIDCGVGDGVTGGEYHLNVHRTVALYPGAPDTVCEYTVDLAQATGTVVVGASGQPRIDVRFGQGQVNAGPCNDAGPAAAATFRFSLAGPPQDRTIGGDFRIIYDDPAGFDYDQQADLFRQQGYNVTLTKSWTLSREPQPEVAGFSAALSRFFLAGIPVTNRYTASIDWDSAPPGQARFILGNDPPRTMSVSGNTASLDLPLASVAGTGDFPISVEADLNGRISRADNFGPLTLVPVPAWAGPFKLQPATEGDHVRYTGVFALPEKPIDAHVDLPPEIPFVGGTWGILPTQLKLTLAASSLGTRETGNLSAQGGFGLGKQTNTLSAKGNIFGTITHDTLNFESDELALSAPPISFKEHVGVISLIPGASASFSTPVIGDFLQQLDSALGVSGQIDGTMTGRGRLGVVGDALKLTEGSFDASLAVLASGGIDTPVLLLTIGGGGKGSLSMQIIPNVKVTDCKVLLSFVLRAGGLGLTALNLSHSFPVVSCTAAGQTVQLAGAQGFATQAPTAAGMANGSIPAANEEILARSEVTNGLSETVLTANASLQARPVLVATDGGRMAFAWNSVSTTGAADEVSLRLFDGTIWGDPVVISQAAHPAFGPSAAYGANGNIIVAWAEAQTAPDPAGLTEAFARSLEIAWAEVNPANGQVLHRGLLTNDAVMDFAPRLSRGNDGSVWLAWQRSPGTTLSGTAASPNHFQAASWTGTGWTATETAGQNGTGVLFWDMAGGPAGQAWLVADVDTDGNLATGTDREIFVYKRTPSGWAAPQRLTNDTTADIGPLVAVSPAGQPAITWRHDDVVLGVSGDPSVAPPQTWFAAAAGVGPLLAGGRLLLDADGSRILVWPDATSQGQDVWLSRQAPGAGTWTRPAPLFKTAEQRRSLSAALLPNGEIALGLAAADITSRTVDFGGGSTGPVPTVSETARLVVAHIPAGYVPQAGPYPLFLPLVSR